MAASGPRAFSLIELLVVLGIIMILMGLGIGAIAVTGPARSVDGSADLLFDLIRQAKHSAQSSGMPVELRIDLDQRTITGFEQVTLLSHAFEGPTAPDPQPRLGLIGWGHDLEQIDPERGGLVLATEPGRSLLQRRGTDWTLRPFALRLWWSLPASVIDPANDRGDAPNEAGTWPLLSLGPAPRLGYEGQLAGLWLVRDNPLLQQQTILGSGSAPDWTMEVSDRSFAIEAWIRSEDQDFALASSDQRPEPGRAGGEVSGGRFAIGFDRWYELGVVYDGSHLSLSIDGLQLQRVAAPVSRALLAQLAQSSDGLRQPWQLLLGDDGGDSYGRGLIDALRLVVLAGGEARQLPEHLALWTTGLAPADFPSSPAGWAALPSQERLGNGTLVLHWLDRWHGPAGGSQLRHELLDTDGRAAAQQPPQAHLVIQQRADPQRLRVLHIGQGAEQ